MAATRRGRTVPTRQNRRVSLTRDLHENGLTAIERCTCGLKCRAADSRGPALHVAGQINPVRTHRKDIGAPLLQRRIAREKIVSPPRFNKQLCF